MQLIDLTPDQAQRLSALLDEARGLPPRQREAWQAELMDREPQLGGLVTELLASMEQAGHAHMPETRELIERRFAQATQQAPALEGRAFGSYRVLRLLGRGGMGAVWLAERADGLFQRQVALKLVHASLAGSTLTERFARERGILAALDHPHIARLLDAGVSDDGQPYLALEYVDGTALTAYCDVGALSIRARIMLVVQVLSAVQHAHQNLVVHRDLKPSNILVTADGQAHLLDFGIAKLMIEGEARETELTELGGRALTPDYASPEQIAGQPVSTASDVYSLGVLLYELLCGQRPYHLSRESRGALEEAILNAEPVRPSQRGLSEETADARSTTPTKLARSLARDLDTIVLKALKKHPSERYGTADAFRDDLQRHLDGEAVLAQPDAVIYRATKFVRRYRVGMAATALVFVALGAGMVGTLWQAREAQQAAQRAQAVQDFLIGLFNEADPVKSQGRELTAREMLDRGQRDLQTKLANRPRLKALLDGVLVELYDKLGDDAKALPLALARRDVSLQLDGSRSLDYGDALYALARVYAGMNRNEIAFETYQQARSVLERHSHERAGALLLIDGRLAIELHYLHRRGEAVDRFEALLPKLESHFGPNSWEVVRHRTWLAAAYSDQGQHEHAAKLIAQIEPALDGADAAHALDAADLRGDLGFAQWNARRLRSAEALLTRAIADTDRLLGPVNSASVLGLRTLGLVLNAQGRFDRAARTFDDGVQRAVRLHGEDNDGTRTVESFAVLPLIMTGQAAAAYSMARRSVRDMDKVGGTTPAGARSCQRRLALALIFNGEADKAVQLLREVLAQEEQARPKAERARGATLLYLAGAEAVQGHAAAAAEDAGLATQAYAGNTQIGDEVAIAHSELTEALARARLGQSAAARQLIEQARAHLLKSPEPNDTDPLFVELVRAEVLRADGFGAEAERVDRAARQRLETIAGVVLPPSIPMVF